MNDLSTVLQIAKVIIDLEAKIELYLKESGDKKRVKQIRKLIKAGDAAGLDKLICGR